MGIEHHTTVPATRVPAQWGEDTHARVQDLLRDRRARCERPTDNQGQIFADVLGSIYLGDLASPPTPAESAGIFKSGIPIPTALPEELPTELLVIAEAFRGGGPSDRKEHLSLTERRAAALAQWAASPRSDGRRQPRSIARERPRSDYPLRTRSVSPVREHVVRLSPRGERGRSFTAQPARAPRSSRARAPPPTWTPDEDLAPAPVWTPSSPSRRKPSPASTRR